MKTKDMGITKLMREIECGVIQLPAFQRDWIWDDDKICSLIASIISAYPIGALMFLECDDESPLGCRPIEGVTTVSKKPKNLILDGQQRLTSIFSAMYNSNKPVTFKVKPWKNSRKKNFYYYIDIAKALEIGEDKTESITGYEDKKNIYDTSEAQFKNKKFPLNIILNSAETSNWEDGYKKYHEFDDDIKKEFNLFREKIITRLSEYEIPVISLEKDTPMEAVCKVFEKINSKNQPLTKFDLVTAIFAKQDKSFKLREDWKQLESKYFSRGVLENFSPENFLRAFNLIVNYKKFSGGEKYNPKKMDISKFKLSDYNNYAKELAYGFDSARKILNEEGILTEKNLPYTSQLIPLAVICTLSKSNNSDVVRKKIKRWYWCGVFGKLYENAANDTKFFNEVVDVMRWIADGEILPASVNNFEFDANKLSEIKSGALFKGIIALIVKNDCTDFYSGKIIKNLYRDGGEVEIHHIFPKDYCSKKYPEILFESIINKTPVDKKTNKNMGNRRPSDYLSKCIADGTISSEEVLDKYLKSHWIEPADLYNDNFKSFIEHRKKFLLDEIANVTGGKIFYDGEK